MEVLNPEDPQHRCVFHGWRRGHLNDKAFVAAYLTDFTSLAGLAPVRDTDETTGLPVPNPVVSRAHKYGLGGLIHLTTSHVAFMGYQKQNRWEYVTVDAYTCGAPPDWEKLAEFTRERFDLVDWGWQPVLLELSGPFTQDPVTAAWSPAGTG